MGTIREFVYSVLVVAVSGAAVTLTVPNNNGISKYMRFLVGIVVTCVLLFPLASALNQFTSIPLKEIEFDAVSADVDKYTDNVIEESCKYIEDELRQRLYDRFDTEPLSVEVKSNENVEELKIVEVDVYYAKENSLLYSDSINFIQSILGTECEVDIMYEDI